MGFYKKAYASVGPISIFSLIWFLYPTALVTSVTFKSKNQKEQRAVTMRHTMIAFASQAEMKMRNCRGNDIILCFSVNV